MNFYKKEINCCCKRLDFSLSRNATEPFLLLNSKEIAIFFEVPIYSKSSFFLKKTAIGHFIVVRKNIHR